MAKGIHCFGGLVTNHLIQVVGISNVSSIDFIDGMWVVAWVPAVITIIRSQFSNQVHVFCFEVVGIYLPCVQLFLVRIYCYSM